MDGQNPEGGPREDEASDLFSVSSYSSGAAIPVIDKVPLTKEEVGRRRRVRLSYVVLAIVVVAFSGWLFLHLSHLAAVDEAVTTASDDGRVASIEAALELLSGDSDPESEALKLRLRTMLVLTGEEEAVAPLGGALAALPGGDAAVARERGIAETYLALAAGDLARAMDNASRVVAEGDYKAEAARSRALAARAVGNVDLALATARIAVDERPSAARHVSLLAELTARAGDTEAALRLLDGLADQSSPETRIARARIMDQSSGADANAVVEIAQSVLDDEGATLHEAAWSRLLLARGAAAAGDRVSARQHLDAAAETAPPGDELFTLTLTEAALRIGADHLAQRVAEGLPSPLSVDAGRRAQLGAELALSRHDLRRAEASLTHAPAGARTSLARARLLEARAQIEPARALYREAANEPAYRVPATVYLAAMELGQGNAQEAISRVDPLLEEHPNHPDVVPVAVEARLGLTRAQQAMELVSPALEAHPGDVRLLAAKAHVQMALEQWEEALATVDRALRIVGDDAGLHADRGRAARRLSRTEVAREGYDAALALNESHPAALVGRLELDLMDFSPTPARQILERIDAAEITSLPVEHLRGRLLTMEIAGAAGIRAVREALSDHRGDVDLTLSLGWLQLQAEQYSAAVRTFGQLTGGDAPSFEAVLGRVLAQIRMRASNPASSAMEDLTAELDESTLAPASRAELHAVLARLALSEDNRAVALREAGQAIEIDPRSTEAHLVLAEIAADREEDASAHYERALVGSHPSSKPLALLAIREEAVTDATCDYASRYRRAAPQGQYARGVWRVQRDCRRR